jgi:uncharacterized protein
VTVVADAGPIIAFASIGRLDLLPATLGNVTVTDIVANEILPSVPVLPAWMIVAAAPTGLVMSSSPRLDPGERSSIALALERRANLLVIDDREGRRVASRLGLEITGSAGIVVVAKRRGLVPSARAALAALVAAGLYLGSEPFEAACQLAGEGEGGDAV